MPINHLKVYQRINGLTQDGIVGPKTAAVMMREFDIEPVQFAHFIGQLRTESRDFTADRENLNYSASVLRIVFPKYFRQDEFNRFAYHPVDIANRVYADRMGNGDELSGDGWRYRGAGASQITGKNTMRAYFDHVGLSSYTDTNVICEPAHYFKSAVWYWTTNKVWDICTDTSTESIVRTSKAINCGNPDSRTIPNGLIDRQHNTREMFECLKLS
jgi:putative chitinase